MKKFLLNTLSAHGTFRSTCEVERALVNLLNCFDVINSALASGAVIVFFDRRIEDRSLLADSDCLTACFSNCQNRDHVKRWYIYTRNKLKPALPESAEFSISANGHEVKGEATLTFNDEFDLLGFGGTPCCDARAVEVTTLGGKYKTRAASCLNQLMTILPRYERSSKHRLEPYTDCRGEYVSQMTLTDGDAQRCLIGSFEAGRDRYAKRDHIFIRFKLTQADGETQVYHGFEVDRNDVPAACLAELE